MNVRTPSAGTAHYLRVVFVLVRPSLLSGTACILAVAGFLGLTSWAFLAHNPALSTYFFGPNGIVTALQRSPFGLATLRHRLFANDLHRAMLTYLFILLLTVAVFTLLEGIVTTAGSVSAVVGDWRIARLRHLATLQRDIWIRMACRLGVTMVGTVYLVVFLSVVVPYCVSAVRYGVALSADGLPYLRHVAVGMGILLLTLHGHIVLLRLFMLRLRIFGDTAVLLQLERSQ
jgi:hypothetical protein